MVAELILEQVYYRYPGTKTDVLKGVNAVFPAGMVTAVMGRSGAGKSTMLYLLSGLDVPSSGRILYNGLPPPGCGYHCPELSAVSHPDGAGKCALSHGTCENGTKFRHC